jgi:putative transposase
MAVPGFTPGCAVTASMSRVARIMAVRGLPGRCKRRGKRAAIAGPGAQAAVIGLASRRVAGRVIADHMESSLACDALKTAVGHRRPDAGFLMHADRGAQCASKGFRALLQARHGVQGLSRKGQCRDNAVGESWFATFKEELIHRQSRVWIRQARRAVIEFTEIFCNRQGLRSFPGYLTPVENEQQIRQHSRREAA